MLSAIITILVLGLIFWLVDYFAIPEPFNKIIKFVLILCCIVVLLRLFGINLWAGESSRLHPRLIEQERLN